MTIYYTRWQSKHKILNGFHNFFDVFIILDKFSLVVRRPMLIYWHIDKIQCIGDSRLRTLKPVSASLLSRRLFETCELGEIVCIGEIPNSSKSCETIVSLNLHQALLLNRTRKTQSFKMSGFWTRQVNTHDQFSARNF